MSILQVTNWYVELTRQFMSTGIYCDTSSTTTGMGSYTISAVNKIIFDELKEPVTKVIEEFCCVDTELPI